MTQIIVGILKSFLFIVLLGSQAFAQKADVLILTGPGGHRSTSDHIALLLKQAGISYAEVDFSAFGDWTFEQTIELSEKDPESSTHFYQDYYQQAAKAKSIANLPQAKWHYADRFMSVLNVVQPKVIYSAYALAGELIEKLNVDQKIKFMPIGASPTDYNLDRYWTYSLPTAATMVFPPSLEWMMTAMKFGTPAGKLLLTGIPGNYNINNVLTPEAVDKLWEGLGFDKNVYTVFVGGGNGGIGDYGKMLDSIKKEFATPDVKIQVLFAVGSNQKKLQVIEEAKKKLPEHIKIAALPFIPNIPDYMNYVADAIVGKGGGLTTTEIGLTKGEKNGVLRQGRPFLIIVPSFGVESGNVEFSKNSGTGQPTTRKDLGKNIRNLINHPEIGKSMMERQVATIASINRPSIIIEWIKSQLQQIKESGKLPFIANSSTMWVYEKLKLALTNKQKPFLTYPNLTSEELVQGYEAAKTQALANPVIKMAITVDDIPGGVGDFTLLNRRDVLAAMANVLRKHNVPQVFAFVNGGVIDDFHFGEAMIKDWLAAGYEIGNHTHNHLNLADESASTYIDNIKQTDDRLAKMGIQNRRYFRYPFLEEGNTLNKRRKIQNYLEKNGYKIAPVTVDVTDYFTGKKYTKALAKNNPEPVVAKAVEEAADTLKESRSLAKRLFGRDINHILLLHLSLVHVELLDRMLTRYENEGVQFISLDEAMSDPVYNEPRNQVADGNFLEQIAEERGSWSAEDKRNRLKKCAGGLE